MNKDKQVKKQKNVEDDYHLTSARDHMLFKEMWGGSANLMTVATLVMSKDWSVLLEEAELSDRFLKCFDEILTNAADQRTKTAKLKKPHKMDTLAVSFNLDTGNIIVSNNGDGFDIAIHSKDEKKRYIPEIMTTEALRGSNFVKEKGNTKAGTNGVGSKLANAHSLKFTLDTYDINRKLRYQQTTLNHIDEIQPPIITAGDDETIPITKIEFQLDYAAVGFGSLDPLDPNDKDKTKPKDKFRKCTITKDKLAKLEKVIRMRVAQMSVFLGTTCTVYYNGEEVPFKTLESLALAVYKDKKIHVGKGKLYAKDTKTLVSDWQIIVAIDVQNTEQISFVNGVVCTEGNHLEKIKEEIHQVAKEKAKDLIESSTVKYHGQLMSGVAIMMSGDIPDVVWGGGQLKTAVKMDKKEFAGLEIDKKLVKDVCEALYDRMLLAKGQTKKSNNVKIKADKYEKANKLGLESSLIVSEGDSADGTVQIGRRNPNCEINSDRFGTFILGGVPMNSRKEVELRAIEGHDPVKIMSKRLTNNETFQQLEAILNLDKNKKYDNAKDRATLNYGCIIMTTDEDLDGYSIFSLVLNHFELFWPELIKAGFIKRLRTPLIRLYPKIKGRPVLEFFDENKAKKFLNEVDKPEVKKGAKNSKNEPKDNQEINNNNNNNNTKLNSDIYEVIYYKGLAKHDNHEITNMFKNIKNNLITLNYDDKAHDTLELYYSDYVDPRKAEFSTPVAELKPEVIDNLEKNKVIDCSLQIKTFTKEYKLDNLTRKLPSIVDGFVITRRRILYGAIYEFGYTGENKFIQIFQFGGSVARYANYHHGDASLNDCITKMARRILTMELLPVLQNKGNTGTEYSGGTDAGSPRYVAVKINRKLVSVLYPKSDSTILNYMIEDGKRSIPKYYAPIVPTVLFRAEKIPADGWNYITWARDIPATLNVLRGIIKNTLDKRKRIILPPSSVGYKGILTTDKKGEEYTLGTYEANEKEIIITSLPLRVWAKPYLKLFLKKEEYKDPSRPNVIKKRIIANEYSDEYKEYFEGDGPLSKCTNDDIKFIFKLKPGALEKIKNSDKSMTADIQKLAEQEEKQLKFDDENTSDNANNDNDIDTEINETNEITDNKKGKAKLMGDAIQNFFGLVVRMRFNLNILSENGAVKEYKNYEDILLDWFPIRKAIYEKRILREIKLLEIELTYLKELLRFLRTYKEIGMSENIEETKMIEILENNKFKKINFKIYNNPGFADENPTDQLEKLTFEKDADYIYLLHTRAIDRSLNNQRKIEAKITELDKKLNMINAELKTDPFPGASQWLREIDEFEKIYQEGIATNWTYGENDNVSFISI